MFRHSQTLGMQFPKLSVIPRPPLLFLLFILPFLAVCESYADSDRYFPGRFLLVEICARKRGSHMCPICLSLAWRSPFRAQWACVLVQKVTQAQGICTMSPVKCYWSNAYSNFRLVCCEVMRLHRNGRNAILICGSFAPSELFCQLMQLQLRNCLYGVYRVKPLWSESSGVKSQFLTDRFPLSLLPHCWRCLLFSVCVHLSFCQSEASAILSIPLIIPLHAYFISDSSVR